MYTTLAPAGDAPTTPGNTETITESTAPSSRWCCNVKVVLYKQLRVATFQQNFIFGAAGK